MDPSIPRAISTQGISFRVRGTDREPFTTLVVRSMKENGGTIENMDRLINDDSFASHSGYTYVLNSVKSRVREKF